MQSEYSKVYYNTFFSWDSDLFFYGLICCASARLPKIQPIKDCHSGGWHTPLISALGRQRLVTLWETNKMSLLLVNFIFLLYSLYTWTAAEIFYIKLDAGPAIGFFFLLIVKDTWWWGAAKSLINYAYSPLN